MLGRTNQNKPEYLVLFWIGLTRIGSIIPGNTGNGSYASAWEDNTHSDFGDVPVNAVKGDPATYPWSGGQPSGINYANRKFL